MKKRLFTLLALGMLIGGVSSLKAQVYVSDVDFNAIYDGDVYEVKNSDGVSVTTLTVTLSGFPTTETEATVILGFNDAAEYLGFPTTVTVDGLDEVITAMKTITVTATKNWDMPNTINGAEGIVFAHVAGAATAESDTMVLYNYPTFTVEYMARTAQFDGSLRIKSITGSNPNYSDYMDRHLKSDSAFTYLTDTSVFVPFSQVEVANLRYGDKIIVTTAFGVSYTLDIPGLKDEEEVPPGTLLRPVTVPVVSDAILSVEAGVHQVSSTTNFTFTITPTGSNAGLVPVVSTGRTTIPDSEGVKVERQSDGSFLVTIYSVQSPINLSIDFTTSNASIEGSKVWASGSQLYVNAAANGSASIYSVTGALVKTVVVAAGETANVSLPTGFYVVTVNGKAYKVTVK